ncbi:MAG: hypothetical protein Q9200_006459 [Gallowayella weberi]
MRLRLTVQRHRLPPARVLWTTTAIRPPYSAAGSEPTIAQLLEQINEIIPLESEDWGLEDYAVEVRGFECLHFSEAKDVLKEDDEVCVRPLGTSDLRIRKVSGRHQISSDGKHLVDGVAFGRPLLRQADRPPIRIPPRKRRRLTYDEDDDEEFEAQRQVVVHSDLESEKGSLSGSDDSEDAVNASDEEEDLQAELEDMRNDLDSSNEEMQGQVTIGGSEPAEESALLTLRRRRTHKAQGLGLIASSILADENGTPYPETYNNPLLDIFADDESAESRVSSSGRKRREPAPGSIRPPKRTWRITNEAQRDVSREVPDTDINSVGTHDPEFATPATVRMETSDDSEDDDFEPPDHASIGENGSDKENATPGSQASTDTDEAAELAAKIDSSFASESDSDTDETSSSGSSTSDSSSSNSSSNESHDTGTKDEARYQDTSSSGTSSSSDTSSDSEEEQPQPRENTAKQAAKASTPKKGPPDERAEGQGERPASRAPVPPGAGRRTTQKRNQRRRDHKKMIRLRDAGKLPPNATITDLRKFEAEHEGQPSEDVVGLESAPNQSEDAHFEEKRQALLKAISTGGVDLGEMGHVKGVATIAGNHTPRSSLESSSGNLKQTKIAAVEKSTSSSSEKTLIGTGAGAAAEDPGGQRQEYIDAGLAASQDDVKAATIASSSQLNHEVDSAPKPRMRLDMESSRRLLFGALGHRAPKTKADEISLQAKLTRDAQSPKGLPPPTVEENDTTTKSPSHPVDSVRWEDKIELSAVECCHEGVELSTPPFPFVQRWDPQQQRGYGHEKAVFSQGSKKRKRDNKWYEDSFEPLDSDTALRGEQRALSNTKTYFKDAVTHENSEGQELLARDPGDNNSQAANDQLLRETLETYKEIHDSSDPIDGLSDLPNDLSACPSLEQAACSAGTIIAFKQLDMSSETNWQPIISDYRTALIDSVLDDGTLLMRMALRDQPREGKQYDQDTGERLYSKFEMPGYNDDESDENNGLLELTFAELIEPKLVRPSGEEPGSSRIKEKVSSNGLLTVDGGTGESEQQSKNRNHSLSDHVVQQVLQDVRDPRKDAEVTEQVRKEIHDLINDAGWRSSVQSQGDVQPEDPNSTYMDHDHEMTEDHENFDVPQDKGYDNPSSPRFNGFSSSPPAEEYRQTEEQVIYPTLPDADVPGPVSPYDEAISDPDRTMADTSSQADREALQAIRQDFEKELQRPMASSKDLDHCHLQSSDDCHNLTSEELSPREKSTSPPPRSSTLQKTIPDSQPPPSSKSADATSNLFDDDDIVQNHNENNSDNEDDLPDLYTVLSSFSSQRADDIKSEHHSSESDEAFMQTLPEHKPSKTKPTSTSLSFTNRHNNNKTKPQNTYAGT